MGITRRDLMTGVAAAAVVAGCSSMLPFLPNMPSPDTAKIDKWLAVKDAIGVEPGSVLDVLLDNARREFQGSTYLPVQTTSANRATLMKVVLPVTPAIYHSLIIPKLVPVQAMTSPVIKIDDVPVLARTRKLSARWTFAASFDTWQKEQQADMEAEIMVALAQEAATEFNYTFTSYLLQKAAVYRPEDFLFQTFPEAIRNAARRTTPNGNWAVVNAEILERFRVAKAATRFEQVDQIDDIAVFVDPYSPVETPALVGHNDPELSTVIWSPYVLFMSSGVTIDPTTYEPTVGFLTRYGLHERGDPHTQFGSFRLAWETLAV
jgi:hypothetical protein